MSCCLGDDDEEQPPRSNTPKVRGCTDVFWLCLFIAFWFLMILIAAFSFVYGNPIRLINGYDTFGNTCGVKNNQKFGSMELSGQDTSDKPFLFFFDPSKILLRKSLSICVKKCPDRTLKNMNDLCDFYRETGSQLCHDKPGYGLSFCNPDNRNATGTCPEKFPIFDSKPLLNRCIPNPTIEKAKKIAHTFYTFLNSDGIEQIFADLYKTWKEILVLSLISFVLSLFMIAIIHFLASLVTWIVVVLVMIATIGGTFLLWITYFDIKHKLDAMNENEVLIESVRNETAFFWFAIIATVITTILFLLICFIRKNVHFMAILLKESAKCLAELPGLFFQPLLTLVVLLVFWAFWLTVFLCLLTSNYAASRSINNINETWSMNETSATTSKPLDQKQLNFPLDKYKTFTLVEYTDPIWVKYMWWVYAIGLLWVTEFIGACQTMIISGAVAHWYFRGKNSSTSPVCSSIGTLFSYHLGSVACGSFLITLFKLPRLILTYLHKKFKNTRENSPCVDCGFKCCMCCFYCLEKFIRYMNHNAYTVIAIEGTHFCKAARIAFTTIVNNAVQVAVINGLGDFILFLGKCFVTAATGSIGLLILKQNPNLNFYAVPIFVTCIFAFFIAHCVISLYETVIDTIFLCHCEDKNLNGENGKWRQSELAQILAESNTNGQQSHELTPMQA